MSKVKIVGNGLKSLKRIINVTKGKSPGGEKLYRAVGTLLVNSTKQRFVDEVSFDGKKFDKSQRVIDNGGITLTDESRLKKSITRVADDKKVKIGTNVIYAESVFEWKNKNKKKTRRPLGVSKKDVEKIGKLIKKILKA